MLMNYLAIMLGYLNWKRFQSKFFYVLSYTVWIYRGMKGMSIDFTGCIYRIYTACFDLSISRDIYISPIAFVLIWFSSHVYLLQ